MHSPRRLLARRIGPYTITDRLPPAPYRGRSSRQLGRKIPACLRYVGMGPVHERIGGPRGRSGALPYCVEIVQEFCELRPVCKKVARIRRRRD